MLSSFPQCVNSVRGAGAPSPPSEEGGGTAYKGLKRRDGRRDTPSVCESTLYRRTQSRNDTCINLCTSTPLCKQQPRVISPSVAPLYPLGAPAPSSEGAEAAPPQATELQKCERKAFLSLSPLSPRSGGARKPNPSEGAEAAPPHTTDLARCKLSARRRSGKRQKKLSSPFYKIYCKFSCKEQNIITNLRLGVLR